MAPWVKPEYANELAVLSAWLTALLPWNVNYTAELLGEGRFLFVRFPFFQVRYSFGVPIGRAIRLDSPFGAAQFQSGGGSLALPYWIWTGTAVVFAAAMALSVVFYLNETWVETWPVDPVRLMGAVLGVGTLGLGLATYYLYVQGFHGLKLPLGLALIAALSGTLLIVDRSDRVGPDPDPDRDPGST
jgi:hypothetical protein